MKDRTGETALAINTGRIGKIVDINDNGVNIKFPEGSVQRYPVSTVKFEENLQCCPICGSTDVQCAMWVDSNTNQLRDGVEGIDFYCPVHENTFSRYVTVADYRKKLNEVYKPKV